MEPHRTFKCVAVRENTTTKLDTKHLFVRPICVDSNHRGSALSPQADSNPTRRLEGLLAVCREGSSVQVLEAGSACWACFFLYALGKIMFVGCDPCVFVQTSWQLFTSPIIELVIVIRPMFNLYVSHLSFLVFVSRMSVSCFCSYATFDIFRSIWDCFGSRPWETSGRYNLVVWGVAVWGSLRVFTLVLQHRVVS